MLVPTEVKTVSDPEDLFDELGQASIVRSDEDDSVEASHDQDDHRLPTAGTSSDDLPKTSEFGDSEHDHDDQDDEDVDDRERIETILPATHEIGANLAWDGFGLSPYWAIVSNFEPDMSDHYDPIEFDDDVWTWIDGNCRYWSGSIAARGQDYKTFNEYQIKVRAVDSVCKREVTFQFRPGLPKATKPDGSRIQSMPEDLPECIRVQVNSVNVDEDELIPLLRAVARTMDIDDQYFLPYRESLDEADQPIYLPSCNVYNYARYTRNYRPQNEGRITGNGGVLDRLEDFSRSTGGSGSREWDNEDVEGHRDAVMLAGEDWSKLLPGTSKPKRVKSYHPKYARAEASFDDPLSNPKLEVQLPKKGENVSWTDLDDLRDELDETLLNILFWAGFDLTVGDWFVEDEYFNIDHAERDFDVRQDPTGAIEDTERELATGHFHAADQRLGRKERDAFEALVADGDGQSYDELAAKADASKSTVYRMYEKMANVIRRDNGDWSLEDGIIRDQFESLFETVERTAKWARSTIDEIVADECDVEGDLGPLGRWARTHAASIEFDSREDRFEVSLEAGSYSKYELRKILRAGVLAADAAGRHTFWRFKTGLFSWRDENGERRRDQRPIRGEMGAVRVLGMGVEV